MSKYEELQEEHQRLLDRSEEVEDPKEILKDVQVYVDQIKVDAEFIPDPRERNQMRANLRYWASYVYDQTGTYPNTNMRPAREPTLETSTSLRSFVIRNRIIFVIIIAAFAFIVTAYFGFREPIIAAFLPDRATQTAEANIPVAAIPIQRTSTPTLTPSPTYTPPPTPTPSPIPINSTQTSPPTLTPSPTNNQDEIVDFIITVAAALTSTPYTPEIPSLPATGGEFRIGDDYDQFRMISYLVSSNSPFENCNPRILSIVIDQIELFSELDLIARVQLSQGGKIVAAGSLPFRTGTMTVNLPNPRSEAAVLVQVDQPPFLFDSVIAQFPADCSRNQLALHYQPDFDKIDLQKVPTELELGWRLETWGPSPDEKSWIATLLLMASGGDGNYIYWATGDSINNQEDGLLLDDQLLVSKEFCDPAQLKLGVTSAGQTIQRDMVLQVPDCIEVISTPVP